MSWKFFADRGGTFTDIVAVSPENKIIIHKILSENPGRYQDAIIQGIREILGSDDNTALPCEDIEIVKIGTTVGTNALLTHSGAPTVLVINQGFADALRIAYQNRPHIFAREIILPGPLYESTIEVSARYDSQGKEIAPLDREKVRSDLQTVYDRGVRSCAIVLLHGYRYPQHEKQIAGIATHIGFTQISLSSEVSPLIKLISRGDITLLDAYLSPIVRHYAAGVARQLQGVPLMFMKSDGILTAAENFSGRDSILSGPAGGIVGAVQTCIKAGFPKLLGFDMGGTSTDVAHYDGEYERTDSSEVAGIRIRTPMMAIHTVAAGGSSILSYDGYTYKVGPESAGANPGPACYRRGGPLCITDANLLLGKIPPRFFPHVFGESGSLPLDKATVESQFLCLAREINPEMGSQQVAEGFITIAVNNMANAIKTISVQRGYDPADYTLCCFGGAGGQMACLVARQLGIKTIFIHPYAGVLSAYGMSFANSGVIKQGAILSPLHTDLIADLERAIVNLTESALLEVPEATVILPKIKIKYAGTDSPLTLNFTPSVEALVQRFEHLHRQLYGFINPETGLIVESISVEVGSETPPMEETPKQRLRPAGILPQPLEIVRVFTGNEWHDASVFDRATLEPDDCIDGPAIVIETTGTNVIEPGWQARLTPHDALVLEYVRSGNIPPVTAIDLSKPNPVQLEIFQNLFKSIAEEMGVRLQNTAASVNIRERLDFSCAIFDSGGNLIANAPHIPIHLGSMSESVKCLIADRSISIKPGDVYASNNPYNGGTHLPDITVITPVFAEDEDHIRFYVASRGHHADIGGITPGSMAPHSGHIDQEGIRLDNFLLVKDGLFQKDSLLGHLLNSPYPCRNVAQNEGDLYAQVAANVKGSKELNSLIAKYGWEAVFAYTQFVQDHAESAVRRVIGTLSGGEFIYDMDNGACIVVRVTIDDSSREATIDFTGTSAQLPDNFNAPRAVVQSAVLYVFRTLVDEDIPLNSGCLKPLRIIIPPGSMLNPTYPAAVVAGNVETSQAIVNALYGALGVMSAAGGTMNNLTFGNSQYQYYETICCGSGAGPGFHGTSAVQTHMTNSRLSDPEVLETNYPVRLESFSIRHGSGGKGRYKGGDGVVRKIKFLEPMTASIISNGRSIAPFGLEGGQPGQKGKNYLHRDGGMIEDLPSTVTVETRAGDILVIETPGGGGYGALNS
ncbi:MAG: hypothetical protein N5P05_002300 [Chroococcopsis gigantea SAG 12.99]|jgi:5-oxoprolinase (ATP-hydrolysing)|nr:hydantoinase B/oxoprolinase family protein [Chlorogloea purpurea SAG 13.99]MDV3000694.1 hypothetical protein [Chroococcopsis gigantea SAG 12.99]